MDNTDLPLTSLDRLNAEILCQPPEAALPCNLSDYWLDLIARDLDKCVGEGADAHEESASYMSAPLALIIHILTGKTGRSQMEVPIDDLFNHFQNYRIEIALENVSRKTDVKAEPATLETIFANRDVPFERR